MSDPIPSAMRRSPPGVYLAQLSRSASLLTSYASWPSFFYSPWLALLICKMDIIIVALHVINNLIFIIVMLIYVESLEMWRAKNSARNIATHKIVVIFVITNEKSEANGMVTWLPSYLKADCFSSTRWDCLTMYFLVNTSNLCTLQEITAKYNGLAF